MTTLFLDVTREGEKERGRRNWRAKRARPRAHTIGVKREMMRDEEGEVPYVRIGKVDMKS